MRIAIFAAIIGVALAGDGSCIGDNSHLVDYRNTTKRPLLVYESEQYKSNARLVPPGETLHEQWLIPAMWSGTVTMAPRQVLASTESGERVFCHRFSYEELQRISWVIDITERNDCS